MIPHDGRVLMVRRADGVSLGGTWCFPGGHIEPGESPEQALRREMREELGVEVTAERMLGAIDVPGGYRLDVFLTTCADHNITPAPAEVSASQWVTVREIATVEPGLPSNLTVVRMLADLSSLL